MFRDAKLNPKQVAMLRQDLARLRARRDAWLADDGMAELDDWLADEPTGVYRRAS